MEQAVGNPSQRVWALWMLGALGTGASDAYGKDHWRVFDGPQVEDAKRLNRLSLVGTDETIPLMLDRFRNDPSPVVQDAHVFAGRVGDVHA